MRTPDASRRDRTLFRVGAFFVLLLTVAATVDLLRGTGGRAWLQGTAEASDDPGEAEGVAGEVLFRDVLLFDGERFREAMDVRIRDGRVVEVGADLDLGAAAEVDGVGRTLLPGLIDAHTHSWGDALRSALSMGTTTVLDMFTEPTWAAQMRAEQEAGSAAGRADLFSAGVLATAPGGHGTQYGIEIPTLEAPEQAEAWVAARVEEGSDFIKIVVERGSAERSVNSLDHATAAAVIDAAHASDRLAVVHVSQQADAMAVVEAGADGIVHVFWDSEAEPETLAAFTRSGAFVVPTLAVVESVSGGAGGAELLADPLLEPYAMPNERTSLETAFPGGDGREAILRRSLESVRRLHEAGVSILAGTDAPNPGTAHGFSMHRELELLVRAGLETSEALAAATSAPADAFGLDGRGRVIPGARADLVLVTGDPRVDISATRAIEGIWKGGVRFDRDAVREAVSRAGEEPELGDGTISDFEQAEVTARIGSGWQISTDQMMGGTSTGEMEIVAGGAAGTAQALRVSGELGSGSMFPWSGPMLMTGAQPFAPTDLSMFRGLSFWLRSEGQVAAMVFSAASGQTPVVVTVPPAAEWTLHELDFEEFTGVDSAGIQAILFSVVDPGSFEFWLDEVRLR